MSQPIKHVDVVATEGIKMPEPSLKEIDTIGAAALLQDLTKTNQALRDNPLAAPNPLTAMADEKQSFYKNNQANPWLISRAN
jgi:hypothetical protein